MSSKKDVTFEANITFDKNTGTVRRNADISRNLNSSLAGVVENIGKLVSIRPIEECGIRLKLGTWLLGG